MNTPMKPAEPGHSPLPDLSDLLSRLHFSTSDGRITLDGRRMLLIHATSFGWLRKEMIEALGKDTARSLFTRMGYESGRHDARMARKLRSATSIEDMFSVGPSMHNLLGGGLSKPVRVEFDLATGKHFGEFLWTHQVEDEEHLRHFAPDGEPSCWMQIGYASGYSSEFMGREILYREVECSSMGNARCRIIGRPLEEWDSAAQEDAIYLRQLEPHGQGRQAREIVAATLPAGSVRDDDKHRPVGSSPGFNSVLHLVQRVAPTRSTVLFLGESGVGKEVFARMLHWLSPRRDKPFVALNCAALPEQLIESELFGAERGAYTGATQSRQGRFERAHTGTIFLDEIGTLSLSAQASLLRALQEGVIERLGDSQSRAVDVRILAATNVDLREEVAAGRFREDLYFRLQVFPIRVTPLRERREDIPLLLSHFLDKFNRLQERRVPGFTQRAIDTMMSYEWPGNVRELENMVQRGVILAQDGEPVDVRHLFIGGESFDRKRFSVGTKGHLVLEDSQQTQAIPAAAGDAELEHASRCISNMLLGENEGETMSLDDIETLMLKKAVERSKGNISAAARTLGLTRPQMVYRLKTRGLLKAGEA